MALRPKPTGARILILPRPHGAALVNGILRASNELRAGAAGTVLAVGPDADRTIRAGDTVLYQSLYATELLTNDGLLLLVDSADLLAAIDANLAVDAPAPETEDV